MDLKIALLAGDGIGPEVIDQAVKVSDAIAKKFNHNIEWTPALTGAAIFTQGQDQSLTDVITHTAAENQIPYLPSNKLNP